jgi:gamma-tubulin complex component 3
MLHFLNELSDLPPPAEYSEASDGREPARFPATPTKHHPASAQVLGSPAFKDAFSRPGLSQIPVNDGSPRASPRPAPADKQDKHRERRTRDSTREQSAETQAVEQKSMVSGPTEPSLLRDLPFTLQGLSSTNLTFPSSTVLKLPSTLPVPLISLLHTLAEPSLLYRGLNDFVHSTEGGLVGQSFRSALDKELRSYLGLVATLEGQIRRALAQLDATQPHNGIGKAGVTLKRCVIWTREATMGLRLMSLMVEESKGMIGGVTRWQS